MYDHYTQLSVACAIAFVITGWLALRKHDWLLVAFSLPFLLLHIIFLGYVDIIPSVFLLFLIVFPAALIAAFKTRRDPQLIASALLIMTFPATTVWAWFACGSCLQSFSYTGISLAAVLLSLAALTWFHLRLGWCRRRK